MNAESVKARLKNFAISSGCTFQEALVYYGLERTIYRLSVSEYADRFVLKGGIFLYAIFDRKYERATTDVDLLARRMSNSKEEMKTVFRDIFAQDTDDALVFDLDSVTAEDITEFKEYHGLHISAAAYLDRTRIPTWARAAAVRIARWDLLFSSHRALAMKRINNILTNSLGWKVIPAIVKLILEPFVIVPSSSTAPSAAIPRIP